MHRKRSSNDNDTTTKNHHNRKAWNRCKKLARERVKVVVVEDHHHVLEHIHAALRRQPSLPSWRMLHIDAHPDCTFVSSIM